MPDIIETVELISKTMDDLIDFIVTDEFLGSEFEKFLVKNKIEIKRESELNDILIDYLLDGKTSDNVRVLDYFLQKSKTPNKKTVEALKKSFVSVFKINKIQKNRFEADCLISQKNYTLHPLVKTMSLRGIGLFDFIKARAFELDGAFYLLEILDCISQYKEHLANMEAVKCIIKNPKIVSKNKDKLLQIKKSILSFNSSFLECFKSNEVVVLNKDIDKLLGDFYLYHTGGIDGVETPLLDKNFEYKYFEIEEIEDDFIMGAIKGFNSNETVYDVGIYSDEKFGLYIIPFLGTINNMLKTKKNDPECVKYLLSNPQIPKSFLIKKEEEYGILVDFVNEVSGKTFKTINEIADLYKQEYNDEYNFSALCVLYNSEVFSKFLGHKEDIKPAVGRNDLCPCGSGKKYKKCCLNKGS